MKSKSKTLTDTELLRLAIEDIQRNKKTNRLRVRDLEEALATRIPIDVPTEQLLRAKAIIKAHSSKRLSQLFGQLAFEDNGVRWGYAPDLLIKTDDGEEIVEQDNATLEVKFAQWKRSRKNSEASVISSNRIGDETQRFAEWVMPERAKGRPEEQITFGNFIRESGAWSPSPEQDQKEDADDEEE
jgi:hypothetical protein